MRLYVITDLEGVAGVDQFAQTRESDMDDPEEEKVPAMEQLERETNACVDGIRSVAPNATIDVLDGHGSGGLREENLDGATYLRRPDEDPLLANDYDGLLFVGQHAMAGAPFAPLRHTQSSLHIQYYQLDGTFVGEFGGAAIQAGLVGTPTIFLAGDDKAALEARQFVPEIETVAVKEGRGEEQAIHLERDVAAERVREGAARAIERIDEIDPVAGFEPPFRMEIRCYEPDQARSRVENRYRESDAAVSFLDDRTIELVSDTFGDVYP